MPHPLYFSILICQISLKPKKNIALGIQRNKVSPSRLGDPIHLSSYQHRKLHPSVPFWMHVYGVSSVSSRRLLTLPRFFGWSDQLSCNGLRVLLIRVRSTWAIKIFISYRHEWLSRTSGSRLASLLRLSSLQLRLSFTRWSRLTPTLLILLRFLQLNFPLLRKPHLLFGLLSFYTLLPIQLTCLISWPLALTDMFRFRTFVCLNNTLSMCTLLRYICFDPWGLSSWETNTLIYVRLRGFSCGLNNIRNFVQLILSQT